MKNFHLNRCVWIIAILWVTHPWKAHCQNPYVSGLLAEAFPGAGYLYNGQTKEGLLTSTLVIPLGLPYFYTADNFNKKSFKSLFYDVGRNLFGYSVYDSYQSAFNKEFQNREIVKIPHYNLLEMYLATFDSRSYKSWKPFLPIGLGLFSATQKIKEYGIAKSLKPTRYLVLPIILALTMTIGMGEESEFRGFQFPAFAGLTNSQFFGNALSSASFGLCHTNIGICSSPYGTGHILSKLKTVNRSQEYIAESSPSDGGDTPNIQYFLSTAIMGSFFAWMTGSEEHGLLQAAASHGLFDAILIASDLITTGNTGRIYLSFNTPLSL